MKVFLSSAIIASWAGTSFAAPSRYDPQPFKQVLQARQTSISDNITVDLGYEIYQGTSNPATCLTEFLGIRFAAPPLGKLRWQAPRPPVYNRSNVIQANTFATQCPQSGFNQPALSGGTFASEDCLFLNVYAPQGAKDLPVLGKLSVCHKWATVH